MTPAVRFDCVSRHYGEVRAVDDVTFEVAPAEFFSMLGPSGSGKTTSLRLIAGFEQPSAGHVEIGGQRADGVPAYDRDVNTVFQDYALFPHMSVAENVGYGLMVKGVARAPRMARVEELLALVQLEGLGGRKPGQLSGGQRQRVALARALINEPKVLLLDEPLGALDLKLREQMQIELKALQRRLGITFIYVTHDQQEALSMSDRLAVFNAGKIEQIGTPDEVYRRPATRFVAGFVGQSNIIQESGKNFAIRPEKIIILRGDEPPPSGQADIRVKIVDVQFHGVTSRFETLREDGSHIIVVRQNGAEANPEVGAALRLTWSAADLHALGDKA